LAQKGKIEKRLFANSYEHSFGICGDIEILMCNDTAKLKSTDKNIIQLDDAIKLLEEAKKEWEHLVAIYEKNPDKDAETVLLNGFFVWKENWLGTPKERKS
jgi:hypothetical protein